MVTLADIAERAEVSKGTVSRVLNNKVGIPISQPTVERIRRAAAELGYRPNALARALVTGRTRAIWLCYHSITEPMFIRILEATEAKARERGYHLVISSDVDSFSAESTIDGLVYIGRPDHPRVQAIAQQKPVMFVTPLEEGEREPNTVSWSEYEAAYLAVKHLTGLGHRTIGALWGDFKEQPPLFARIAGFRAAVQAFGVAEIEEMDEQHPDPIHRGYLQMQRLLKQTERPTAIFARNDYLAIGALKCLYEARIAVPQDMSMIYYGDSILARAAYVSLTSVSHPNAEASVLALDQLINRIEGGIREFPNVSLPITLQREHDSCAPPHQA